MTDDYQRGTREYIKATVHADVDLDAQSVVIAVGDITPETATWLAAEWYDDPWTTQGFDEDGAPQTLHHRHCRTTDPLTLDAPTYALPGQYAVGVKVTDLPEIPIMLAGYVTLA